MVVCDVMLQGEGLLSGFNVLSEESHLVKVNCSFDLRPSRGNSFGLMRPKLLHFLVRGKVHNFDRKINTFSFSTVDWCISCQW